jgi:TP901 family phage tail tape measure protein
MSDISFDIIGRDRASVAFRNVGKSAQQANRQVTGFGTSLKEHVGKFAALTAGSLGAGALIGFAKSAIDTEKSYSTSMRTIKAATNATGAQMDKLNKQAIDLGQKTVFSAGDAADAMLELGKAGQNAGQIMQTVPQVMNLAATEGMGLADAAGVVTSALAQFGLKAGKSAVVVNALAGASNASKASVASMSEALNYGGAAAHAVGLTVQETSGALAALAQHGQEGSVAGSALASVFNHLQPQTTKAATAMSDLGINFVKANGSFKSISQIAQILQSKLGGLTPAARKADISAIFGRNASSIAAVLALMNEGAKGINRYTKASSDMNSAARLSAARMGGTAGAIEQLNGSIDTAKLKLGQALAPMVIKVSNYLAQHLVPAMDDTITFAKDLGNTLNATVIPPLKVAGELALDVAKFFGGLPGPLKSVGVEAGIAALVFPRLASGVATATTAIKDQITNVRVLRLEMAESINTGKLSERQTIALGNAAKMAAGVGGMLALAEGAKTSSKELSVMASIAGGAAMGFAFGGNPLSAAVGAVAGGLTGLIGAMHKSNSALEGARKPATDYASSLDAITGAATRATRAVAYQALQQSGALVAANKLGLGQRTLVDALLGQKDALGLVNAAVAKATSGTRVLIDSNGQMHVQQSTLAGSAMSVASALGIETNQLHKDIAATRRKALATGDLSKVMHGVPKKIATRLVQEGARPHVLMADLKGLIITGKLVPKQIKTIVTAMNLGKSAKDLMSLARTSGTVKSTVEKDSKQTGNAWSTFFGQGVSAGKPKVDNSLNGLVLGASKGVSGKAKSGGSGVGFNMAIGLGIGISTGTSFVNAAATQIIANALAHMRAAAKTKSPSRKTMQIGNNLGDGLRIGLRQRNGGAMSAGVALIESLVKGIDQHKVRVKDVLGKLTDYIDKQTSKISGLMSKRQGIIDSVKGFSSSVFSATFQDAEGNDRAGSVADLIAFQQQQAAQAAQVRSDIQTLIKDKLSGNLLNQLLSEGASGIANIHTLAGASASDIAAINQANAATQSSLAAGGNAVSGALGVNKQLSDAEAAKRVAVAMAVEFRKVLREEKKDTHVYVEIDGHTLHTLLLKERQKKRAGLGLG